MQHVHRHGILSPKGLLTPGSVLSAILIGGIVVLLAGHSAYTQVGQEANKVLVGAAAFGDWHNDAPGVRRLITAQDLPEIGKEEPSFASLRQANYGPSSMSEMASEITLPLITRLMSRKAPSMAGHGFTSAATKIRAIKASTPTCKAA
jgi:hypothetical protein